MGTGWIVLLALLGLLILLAVIVLVRMAACRPPQKKPVQKKEYDVDPETLAEHLSGAVQIRTIAGQSVEDTPAEPFLAMHAYLEKTFPLIHQTMEKEIVHSYSLLFKWKGRDPSKKPIIMMGHMDVVPVEESTLDQWEQPPWSGKIADGYVWGRGAIDMKGHLFANLEAVEYLLRQGFQPERDIYLALGHDEEQMGLNGGKYLAERLQELGVHAEYVFDEGGAVVSGKEFGVDGRIAAVGIAEKSTINLKLTARSQGGHASMPPRQTAVGALCEAVEKLEKIGFPMDINETAGLLFKTLRPYMKPVFKMALCNLWLFKPVFMKIMGGMPKGAAMLHTTAAPTMLNASMQPNVLAQAASAVVNLRLVPGETIESTLAHVRKLVGEEIELEVLFGCNPPSISSMDTPVWQAIDASVRENIGEDIIVSPYLMMASTDSRLYEAVTENTYRFDPFISVGEDLGTIHGVGERMGIDSLVRGCKFFISLIEKTAG